MISAQPRTVRIAGAIGALQSIALASYAVALVSFEASSSTTGIKGSELAPAVLVGLYLVFAALVFAVSYLFVTGRSMARTPFLLVQLFGIVVSQPLFSGDGSKPIAVAVVLASVTAIGCALSPSARGAAT